MQSYGKPFDKYSDTHDIYTNVAFSLGKYSWNNEVNYRECFTLSDSMRRANGCLFRSILMNGNPGCYVSQTELRHKPDGSWIWNMSNTRGHIIELVDHLLTYIVLKFHANMKTEIDNHSDEGLIGILPKALKDETNKYLQPNPQLIAEYKRTLQTFITETSFNVADCRMITEPALILLYGVFCDNGKFANKDGHYRKKFSIGNYEYYIDYRSGSHLDVGSVIGFVESEYASYDYSMRAAMNDAICNS